jgi:protein-S-isoprenylcysteine O-methyltransferase Ste14
MTSPPSPSPCQGEGGQRPGEVCYNTKMETENENPHKNKVHKILARSYSVYLFLFLIGICLNLIFNFKVFNNPSAVPIGIFFLMAGTLLILWAQRTSRNLRKENISKETFCHGPYRFTRTPTNFGLFFLILGFGMIVNSLFIVLSAFISFVIAKFIFLNKEEKILAEKYGAPYLEYKQSVKF